jgi:uncharacterized protein YceK
MERNMRKILFILLALLMTGCSSLVGQASSEADRAQEKWQNAGISHYRYELAISCFCVFSQDMPLVIEVKDGEVVSLEYKSGKEIDAANMELFQRYDTIDKILAELEKAQSQADRVEVTYDENYGFPTQITIDQVAQAADDELYLTISNFEVLP